MIPGYPFSLYRNRRYPSEAATSIITGISRPSFCDYRNLHLGFAKATNTLSEPSYIILDFTIFFNIIKIMSKILEEKDFVRRIEEISKQKVLDCYQCGRCTAGCPFAQFMDIPPNKVIRLIQLGLKDDVLVASGPWFCASCLVCQTRCPKGVDIPRLMEAVRVVHLRAKQGVIDVDKIDDAILTDLPPLALMSAFSKYSY
jgi:heterodisulfide reductase subunit C